MASIYRRTVLIPTGARVSKRRSGTRYAEWTDAGGQTHRADVVVTRAGDRIAETDKRGGKLPWQISFTDESGRRKSVAGSTDLAATEVMAQKIQTRVRELRLGTRDASDERFALEGRRSLSEHVSDYLAHCKAEGQAKLHLQNKRRYLRKLIEQIGAVTLLDVIADRVAGWCDGMTTSGLSAATVNAHLATTKAFLNWCVQRGRLRANPLKVLRPRDEGVDRRYVRRPLSEDELGRLLAAAPEHRRPVYLLAALAGLRRSEIKAVVWGDFDLGRSLLTVRATVGKSRREDVLPLHPQIVDTLRAMHQTASTKSTDRVIPTMPDPVTIGRDLRRAGIADQVTETVYYNGHRQRRTRNVPDADGRWVGLHALRTTLGTMLAKRGVAPQIAQRIMRHSSYKTTLKHYTVLGLADTAGAVNALPMIEAVTPAVQVAATGTNDGLRCAGAAREQRNDTPNGTQMHLSGGGRRKGNRVRGSKGMFPLSLSGQELRAASRHENVDNTPNSARHPHTDSC